MKGRRKSSYLLKDFRNFNEVFRKDVTYDNIKSHKKQGFALSLENTFLEKPQGEGQIDPPPPNYLGLNRSSECALL